MFESDADTWTIIRGFSQAMRSQSGGSALAVGGCSGGARGAGAAPECAASRVEGRTGTGSEGPRCSLDVNECSRGTAGCDPNAVCTNTPGAYSCRCSAGYAGDGFSCQPTAQLAAVQAQYTTEGAAQLACSEGSDVLYPEGAPGFQYDVTGALDRVKDGGQKVGAGWGLDGRAAAS